MKTIACIVDIKVHTYIPLMCVAHEYRGESTHLKCSTSHWG